MCVWFRDWVVGRIFFNGEAGGAWKKMEQNWSKNGSLRNPTDTGFKKISSVVWEHLIRLTPCRRMLCSILLNAAVRHRSNNRVSLPLSLLTFRAVTASKARLELLTHVTLDEVRLTWNYYFSNHAGTKPRFRTVWAMTNKGNAFMVSSTYTYYE